MKTLITYGTFDLFHVGHVKLLERLYDISDRLIVGVSTDEFNAIKGKRSFFSYEERVEILKSCKFVDMVIPENNWEQKISDIKKYSVDAFAIGDDWKGEFDFLSNECQVIYLERTKDISTTDIKIKLSSVDEQKLDCMENSIHEIFGIIKEMKNSSK